MGSFIISLMGIDLELVFMVDYRCLFILDLICIMLFMYCRYLI